MLKENWGGGDDDSKSIEHALNNTNPIGMIAQSSRKYQNFSLHINNSQ